MDGYYNQQFSGDFHLSNQPGVGVDGDSMTGIDLNGMGESHMFSSHMQDHGQHEDIKHRGSIAGGPDDMSQHNVMQFEGMPAQGQDQDFDFVPASNNSQVMMGSVFGNHGLNGPSAQQGHQGLNVSTHFNHPTSPISNMATPTSAYHSPHIGNMQMGMQTNSPYLPQNMQMSVDYGTNQFANMVNGNQHNFNGYSQGSFSPHLMVDPMSQDFSNQVYNSSREQSGGMGSGNNGGMSSSNSRQVAELNRRQSMNEQAIQEARRQSQMSAHGPSGHGLQRQTTAPNQNSPMPQLQQEQSYPQNQPQPTRRMSEPSVANHQYQQWQKQNQNMHTPMAIRPMQQGNYTNAYSSTGFDMLTVLMRVATRKNPEVNIGAVDLSCAFVVCDITEHDIPIVYCSENFERLTGYTRYEVLGRNCRFLQAPDGKVQAGVKRAYADDDSVLYLKNMITARREAQVSLINYRKGGQPFMNLLTMIPVAYDTDEIKFIVGFQVDLVEQPSSVTNKNPDGTYTINYQRGLTMPRYVFSGADRQLQTIDSGQTVSRDDVTAVLSTMGTGESELSKRVWDKVLLENTDDVVFVLSLKGLFLYLSPSSKKILEYDPNELTGTALSSVCHPSDIVPVTRELKDTSSTASVNIVFRIRRQKSGYMWFEGHGALHTEQGKGRKSIVLVGRERPVYTLSKTDILASGGIGESEVWTKLSTSGIFLFISSNIRSLLDKTPDELLGTNIQTLMRPESRADFLRILEITRTGKRASTKHELLNKRGQVLQAYTTLFPGDAAEGQKPTFAIAQTRLLKYSRPGASTQRTQSSSKLDRDSGSSKPTTPAMGRSPTMPSPQKFMSTFETTTTYAGQHGLEIGHQDVALASEENLFDELKTTRSTSWQFELRQMEKCNRLLAEELQSLLAARKKRKRRKGGAGAGGQAEKDCANCHTRVTPEWRRGPSGNRDLCNSCGLRYAKQQGRISPRTNSQRSVHSAGSDGKASAGSPPHAQQSSPAGGTSSPNAVLASEGPKQSIDSKLSQRSPQNDSAAQQVNASKGASADDSHVSKAAKIEKKTEAPPRRYSGGSGLPTKIEEGEEPVG